MIASSHRQVQSGPMQRSDRLIIYFPIHSIPDGSSLRHGVNKIFHLSLGLFHPSLAGSLELVLAEERCQLFSMLLMMMLSLSTLFPALVQLSGLLSICQRLDWYVHDQQESGYQQSQVCGLQTSGCPTLVVDLPVA